MHTSPDESIERSGSGESIADDNVRRLVSTAYRPEVPDRAFVERTRHQLRGAARQASRRRASPNVPAAGPARSLSAGQHGIGIALAATVLAALVVASTRDEPRAVSVGQSSVQKPNVPGAVRGAPLDESRVSLSGARRRTARPLADPPKPDRIALGDSIETGPGQQRRVELPDGTILYVDRQTLVTLTAPRRLSLDRGNVYLEVMKQPADQNGEAATFVVETPRQQVTALGTRLAVSADARTTEVVVTQGKVRASGLGRPLVAGERLRLAADAETPQVDRAPRASHTLAWTRDLMTAARPALVPASRHGGGRLVAIDPNGEEAKFSLRKFHVDVHIEDGFARTTIDQTYFNHLDQRLEGTFYFPLPADASLSRLAMYVAGKRMEGGMAERDHARRVFESIKSRALDPALLEWVDGTTFKMRVFPLEGRQEKRIILSYTQRLVSNYGQSEYRFAAGHNMPRVGRWSTRIHVHRGAELAWKCESHQLAEKRERGHLDLTAALRDASPEHDIVLKLHDISDEALASGRVRFSSAEHETNRYLMLRYRPQLHALARRERRDWIVLFETSADRNPLLARTQIEILRAVAEQIEHDDTLTVLTASTRTQMLQPARVPATPEHIADLLGQLQKTHLIGALDVEKALVAVESAAANLENPHLLHLGTGTPILGERDNGTLARRLADRVKYVGVGVGKRWNRALMKQAASRTGGYFTQINPDEDVAWRALGALAALDAPRLSDIAVTSDSGEAFLCWADSVLHGEEICAIVRRGKNQPLPESVTVTARYGDAAYEKKLDVMGVAQRADYLPRTWARLEIDRLLAVDAAKHREQIVKLSKAMYVMSPFTSLLVLENEAMYKEWNVDRGRKDHWALYPAPENIAVVHEPYRPPPPVHPPEPQPEAEPNPPADELLDSIIFRLPVPQAYWHQPVWPVTARQWRDTDVRRYAPGVYESQDLILTETGTLHDRRAADFDSLVRLIQTTVQPSSWDRANNTGNGTININLLEDPMMWRIISSSGNGTINNDLLEENLSLLVDQSQTVHAGGELFFTDRYHSVLVPNVPQQHWLRTAGGSRPSGGISTLWTGARGQAWGPEDRGLVLGGSQSGQVIEIDRFADAQNRRLMMGQGFVAGVAGSQVPMFYYDGRRDKDASSLDWLPNWVDGGVDISGRAFGGDEVVTMSAGGSANWGTWRGDATATNTAGIHTEWTAIPTTRDYSNAFWYRSIPRGHAIDLYATVTSAQAESGLLRQLAVTGIDGGFQYVPRGDGSPDATTIVTAKKILNILGNLPGDGSPDATTFETARRSLVDAVPQFTYPYDTSRGPRGYFREVPIDHFHNNVFDDLTTFAPGLQTTDADVLAILEAEGVQKPQASPGRVDPKAAAMIRKARERFGWHRLGGDLHGDAAKDEQPSILFDGEGRYRIARRTAEGLFEQIVCDGEHLWHLYSELGVGARRQASRFHRAAWAGALPWLLPTADDLARAADVLWIDEHTVAVVPRRVSKNNGNGNGNGNVNGDDEDKSKQARYVLHLVFDDQGRLAERRIVSTADGKTVLRVELDADGTVRVTGTGGRRIGERTHRLVACDAPSLAVPNREMLILPLPWRTPGQVIESRSLGGNIDFATISDDDATALVAAYFACGYADELKRIVDQRFFASLIRGEDSARDARRRGGMYVLLRSIGPTDAGWTAHASIQKFLAADIDSKLPAVRCAARLLASKPLAVTGRRTSSAPNRAVPLDPDDKVLKANPFFASLLALQTALDAAATNDQSPKTPGEMHAAVDAAFAWLATARSAPIAWHLTQALSRIDAERLGDKAAQTEFYERLADAYARLTGVGPVAYAARYEQARCTLRTGDRSRAWRLFADLYVRASRLGQAPVDADFFVAMSSFPHATRRMETLLTDSADRWIDAGARRAAIAAAARWFGFAEQLAGNADVSDAVRTSLRDAGNDIVRRALAEVGPNDRVAVRLDAIGLLMRNEAYDWSEKVARPLLDDEKIASSPWIWRIASEISERRGRALESAARWQRALDIEFAELQKQETVDLPSIQNAYGELLARYGRAAEALREDAHAQDSADLPERIVAAADRWRGLDADPTAACHAAGAALQTLGLEDMAWDYWVTPLADRPNEAEPWVQLAATLRDRKEISMASQAYATAFEAEGTNAQVLWDHADMLAAAGEREKARQLRRQIADGTWPRQFESLKHQARQSLQAE